jgi:two-component system chemotaxis response regulator CheY
MIKELFSPYSEKIIECVNGMEAVECYESFQPDWVFMDVKMRPMNGISALIEIKKNYPLAKVIMVTNYIEDEIRTASLKAGAFDFVYKENIFMLPELVFKNKKQTS